MSVDLVRRWTAALEALYYCFTVRPWFRNVPKSLRRQPKVYLWDWSMAEGDGPRAENLVASHLLKAVQWWTDVGIGSFELFYLRDKAKREVDFLVARDEQPWFQPADWSGRKVTADRPSCRPSASRRRVWWE